MRKAPYKRTEITPQQRRLWEDTLSALSWIGPGFIHVIYTMLSKSGNDDTALFTDDIKHAAATDGIQIILNPSIFFKYTLLERVFIVLHETMHEMLNHVKLGYAFHVRGGIKLGTKTLPYNHDFANNMQDYIINDVLIKSKLGKFNDEWLHDEKVAGENDQWIEAYFKWGRQAPSEDPETFGLERATAGTFDQHLPPGESDGTPPEELPERNDAQWQIVIKQAMEIQATQGKMPGALKLFFDALLRPKVDWTEHIRGHIVRLAGSGAYDWRKLDRRLIVRGIGSPGMSGHGAGLIIVGGDSSGSIFSDPELPRMFISEIGGMLEDTQPEEIHVVWCDTAVRRVDICHDPADVKKMLFDGVPGGGGTDFRPVFDYIERNDLKPDMLIYLTDGYGDFPAREPDYPVVWGSITDADYPWGVVVRIPVDEDNG